ncbi:MAG: hypothetical protein UV57_C0011G0013 [Parcubacteria group bacterium GW2011_GWD2_43_10]|uniref:Uncharacterized protein n=4 Tax=Candidatus Vebleniibacteriota TaxID=1817921 RepID=A0A1G2Q4T8_9BACT|nr:MAG: hypothetical protein UV47_C0001G0010 [Parcubacteria group bacterium GW2011_GWA2_42_80]KKS79122.1 MAG: hypothetical protein UV52_C0017G0009 [Parcubacteria group bacterium GW2011_GWD1_42_9]KKS83557.1 MAG: hypothetical protein UV57_C0011G0013 [Parcubacteria group bacterium GW2011_GWD2_43_10]KKS93998.1 MAG: hypothetical protein UV69_C0002G0009 [Parcubacteria group bacterium GW2011_GWE2_43_12]KKT14251.1 MAG: hypothetical protein UV92_C0003G0017 [Parcubacteria group bacterium GW2011_GWA1_43_2
MNKDELNKEAVKTTLASIKIAWQTDPKLWRSLVLNKKFWEEVSHLLEAIADWGEQDDALLAKVVARFKSETANLPLDIQVKKLADLLLGGWKNTKMQASLRQELKELTDRINKKSAKS